MVDEFAKKNKFWGLLADGEIERQGPLGLITDHTYSISTIQMVDIKTSRSEDKIMRNLRGNEAEWKGVWSSFSHKWQHINKIVRQVSKLAIVGVGEFL